MVNEGNSVVALSLYGVALVVPGNPTGNTDKDFSNYN